MSNTNKKLKEITTSYFNDYERICRDSREECLKEMKPGERIPKDGIIYGDEAKELFNAKAIEYRNNANALIDAELDAIRHKISEAPSTEALNSVSLMALRKNVTSENINDLISRYGDNVMVFETIKDLGKQKNVISESEFTEHPLRVKLQAMENVRRDINRNLDIHSAEQGHASKGFIALLNARIDEAFDPE